MAHPRWQELDRLTLYNDPHAVLQIATLEEIAGVWCEYSSHDPESGDADRRDAWAFGFGWALAHDDDRQLQRDFIGMLLRRADNDPELCGAIGAGPLEDYLPQTEEDFAWLARLADDLPGTRTAVATLWVDGDLSAAQMERLDRIAGTRLTRQKPK